MRHPPGHALTVLIRRVDQDAVDFAIEWRQGYYEHMWVAPSARPLGGEPTRTCAHNHLQSQHLRRRSRKPQRRCRPSSGMPPTRDHHPSSIPSLLQRSLDPRSHARIATLVLPRRCLGRTCTERAGTVLARSRRQAVPPPHRVLPF